MKHSKAVRRKPRQVTVIMLTVLLMVVIEFNSTLLTTQYVATTLMIYSTIYIIINTVSNYGNNYRLVMQWLKAVTE